MKKIFCLLLLVAVVKLNAQGFKAGYSYFDDNKWTEFSVGNMPLVISVPHGGLLMPPDIDDRSCPDIVTAHDSRTIELAKAIDSVFRRDYGFYPSLIICNLKRTKIDQNREIEIATCGNEAMKVPWNYWHNMVDTAIAMATKKYGQTVYIDLHAQGHPHQRLELGYLLKTAQLKELSTGNNDTLYTAKSSLHNLIYGSKGKLNLKQMLTGSNAFGTWMTESNFPSVPSQQDPFALEDEKYFDGGYNTARYTKYPNVFGWQIETNYKGVRDTPSAYFTFAEAFVKNIMRYIATYTDIDVKKIGK
ncbi:hypothetical protein [Parasediminibacterium sp. JCM 36343]|uniref:hypothetical protein n=1 Tax=Parasediminibacterium sp. JCM 36343 TaxID=3374279 RepID=UPI00397A6103